MCGSDDVVDVTDGYDVVAMGLCANGHVHPIEVVGDRV
jgi:hypothetical protein